MDEGIQFSSALQVDIVQHGLASGDIQVMWLGEMGGVPSELRWLQADNPMDVAQMKL